MLTAKQLLATQPTQSDRYDLHFDFQREKFENKIYHFIAGALLCQKILIKVNY